MNCKEIQTTLLDWLDGSMDAATAASILEHVKTCAGCTREAKELQELLVAMKNSPLEIPPAVLRESFDTMLQSELNMLTTANIIREFPAGGNGGKARANDHDDKSSNDHDHKPSNDHDGKPTNDHDGKPSNDHDDKPSNDDDGKPTNDHDDKPTNDHYDKPSNDHDGKSGTDQAGKPGKNIPLPFTAPVWRVAAALLLLGSGIGIGMALKSRPAPGVSTSETLVALRQEVKEMKEEVMLNMIDDESASQRIKAVSYSEELASPDQQVIDVLVNTLNQDKNVNVRLAALYSLQRFSDRRAVRDSLVNSLRRQKEPIIQVVLINLLAEKRDTRAIKPIQDIMTDKKTLKEVKDAAQRSLKNF